MKRKNGFTLMLQTSNRLKAVRSRHSPAFCETTVLASDRISPTVKYASTCPSLCAAIPPLAGHPGRVFPRCRSATLGFTLLEIVIALAILAIVFTSLYGAYSGTLEATERVENERNVEQAARLALMQIADDLKSLYYQEVEEDQQSEENLEESPYRFAGADTEVLEGGRPVLEFATAAHLGFDGVFPNLHINRVRYQLEIQSDTKNHYRLMRLELPFVDLGGERQENEIELADGVEKLEIGYTDANGVTVSDWDSSTLEPGSRMPRLVTIRLQMASEETGRSRLFTAIVAPMAWEKPAKE
ncbi:MAG: prepilin-type N-terminal cleavage/methylation domain-containing protein [Deltaproteobacteria bacterium]|nr:MAG: prepilin-type N-terminal cleavage/methylation domain-containing protein [Deltaproteobacteria bacterium]